MLFKRPRIGLSSAFLSVKKLYVITIIVILAATSLIVGGIAYASSPSEQAKVFAASHFDEIVGEISEDAGQFSISDSSALDRATFGEPVQYYELPRLVSMDSPIASQMTPNNFFVFPLLVDGRPILDVQVFVGDEGDWHFGMGGDLTRQIEARRASLQAKLGAGPSEYRAMIYIRQTWIVALSGDRLAGVQVEWAGVKDEAKNTGEVMKALAEELRDKEEDSSKPSRGFSVGALDAAVADYQPRKTNIEAFLDYAKFHLKL